MGASHVLLLTVNRGNNCEGTVPGKLYEYLASGRPILCLSPVFGETASLVERHKGGVCSGIDDPEEIHRALQTLYNAWVNGSPLAGADRGSLEVYDRRYLTGQLAGILSKVIAK
jgi:glycosyltransferase involved in cell wall biosynthesis